LKSKLHAEDGNWEAGGGLSGSRSVRGCLIHGGRENHRLIDASPSDSSRAREGDRPIESYPAVCAHATLQRRDRPRGGAVRSADALASALVVAGRRAAEDGEEVAGRPDRAAQGGFLLHSPAFGERAPAFSGSGSSRVLFAIEREVRALVDFFFLLFLAQGVVRGSQRAQGLGSHATSR